MTLKEYASKIYSQIKSANSTEAVEKLLNEAIRNLQSQNFSDKQIEEFKEHLRGLSFMRHEAQENEQTIKNQKKALELLKRG